MSVKGKPQVKVYLTEEARELLRKGAQLEGMSISAMVEELVREAFGPAPEEKD